MCHLGCANSLPNHCGLPSELADSEFSLPISFPKKQCTFQSSGLTKDSGSKSKIQAPTSVEKQMKLATAKAHDESLISQEREVFLSTPRKTGTIKLEMATLLRYPTCE